MRLGHHPGKGRWHAEGVTERCCVGSTSPVEREEYPSTALGAVRLPLRGSIFRQTRAFVWPTRDRRARSVPPIMPKPLSIIAQLAGSGTAGKAERVPATKRTWS